MLHGAQILQLIPCTAVVTDGVEIVERVNRISGAGGVGGRAVGDRRGSRAGSRARVDVTRGRRDVLDHVRRGVEVFHFLC